LLTDTLQLTIILDLDERANNLVDELNAIDFGHWGNKRRSKITRSIRKALTLKRHSKKSLEGSIDYLLYAFKHLKVLDSSNVILQAELTELICIYQRMWTEQTRTHRRRHRYNHNYYYPDSHHRNNHNYDYWYRYKSL